MVWRMRDSFPTPVIARLQNRILADNMVSRVPLDIFRQQIRPFDDVAIDRIQELDLGIDFRRHQDALDSAFQGMVIADAPYFPQTAGIGKRLRLSQAQQSTRLEPISNHRVAAFGD
jgi:hypothetical protein